MIKRLPIDKRNVMVSIDQVDAVARLHALNAQESSASEDVPNNARVRTPDKMNPIDDGSTHLAANDD